MLIGEVVEQTGISAQTLRYYENLGLLKKPKRRSSGYREYSVRVVGEVRFIRRAQELGFSLKEVSELLQLRRMGGNVCQSAVSLASSKLRIIQKKIDMLIALRSNLEKLISSCDPSPKTGECSAIESLLNDIGQGSPARNEAGE